MNILKTATTIIWGFVVLAAVVLVISGLLKNSGIIVGVGGFLVIISGGITFLLNKWRQA